MDHSEFPPNSEASKRDVTEDRDVQRVTSGEAKRRRKPLRKQFKNVFFVGDVRTSLKYAALDIGIPLIRDAVFEIIQSGFEKWYWGDTRSRRGATVPQSGPTGYIQYHRMGMGSRPSPLSSAQRVLSRRARSQHDFDEILLDSRVEAEEVIDRLFDLVSRYDTATVADLYELVGLTSSHTDHKWGWTDLRGSGVSRTRDGYLLDLPDPIPLD